MKTLITGLFLFVAVVGCNEIPGASPMSSDSPPRANVPTDSPVGPGVGTGTPYSMGTDVGNGGDHVRSTFLRIGAAILNFLESEEAGKNLVSTHQLKLEDLRATLSIQKISSVEGELKDNGGSDVDAVGVPGKITLKSSSWLDHYEKERDVYYLVFHEMLRSASVPDDNYVISKALNPFPANLKIATRVVSLLPLVGDDLLSSFITKNAITFNGNGCPVSQPKTLADFDAENNVLDLTFKGYTMELSAESTSTLSRQTCAIALPFQAPEGKQLVVSQIDFTGNLNLPVGAKATVNIEAFTPETPGEKHTKVYETTIDPVLGRFQVRINEGFATQCGKAQTLRVNTSAKLDGKEGKRSKLKVDKLLVYLKAVKCQ